ncbi:tRNA-dihydrouridine synthase family protein [Haloferula rosea]|uniref:tRNA-dihydrouridine synthase n=2 Tax=Haloferula rosea TaxID=490093 RepID=A0A934VGY8_9BACT|nr:tRNA-dihydrouridine synthase family protein [Haloferula rosea]
MQDVTNLSFLEVLHRYGDADIYVTEYFRVHSDSRPDPWILRSIDENPTGRPIFAQMIGQDIDALIRTAGELAVHPIAGIDLNLGCPAPVVCRKEAGGGLLRNLPKVDRILGSLRDAIPGRFTVKTRVGYHSHEEFDELLALFARHAIDALAIHGRTVVERYQTPVHTDCVRQAVETLKCPVIANGNVVDVETGRAYHARTGCAGLMIGRGAIRNPWLFEQLRSAFLGKPPHPPTGRELLGYIDSLYQTIASHTPHFDPKLHVQQMKKTMVFVTQGHDPDFEFQLRRCKSQEEFYDICRTFLDHNDPVPSLPSENSRLFCGFSELTRQT